MPKVRRKATRAEKTRNGAPPPVSKYAAKRRPEEEEERPFNSDDVDYTPLRNPNYLER